MAQERETLVESDYELVGWLAADTVVLKADYGTEVYIERDHHWGRVIEIDGVGFKFKRTATPREIENAMEDRPKTEGVYIHLFHGRNNVDEAMDDWGFDGPVLGPLPYVHVTYMSDIKIGDDFEPLQIKGDCVEYDGKYYGDWSMFNKQAMLKDGFKPVLPKKRDE